MISLLTRPLRLVALVALIGAGVGAYMVWSGAHSSTAADQGGALADYRAKAGTEVTPPPGMPAPGVYRYRALGSESAGSGVVSATRPLPAEALYIISPITGGYHEDLRLSQEHLEEARYRVDDGAARVLWRRTKVTFLGVGEDDRSEVTPPSIDRPATLSVGRRWGGRYVLGALSVEYRGRVISKGTATLDGTRIPIVVLRTESTFAGRTPGTRTDIVRWSPTLSLPVTWSIAQKTGGVADFAITADLRLQSGTPLR